MTNVVGSFFFLSIYAGCFASWLHSILTLTHTKIHPTNSLPFQAFTFSILVKCMEFCRFLMLMDSPKLLNITNFEPTSYKLNQTLVFLDQLLDSLNWINPKHICVILWTHIFAPAHYVLFHFVYAFVCHELDFFFCASSASYVA